MRLLSDLVSQTTFDVSLDDAKYIYSIICPLIDYFQLQMVELFDIMVALLNDLPAQTGTLLPTFSTRESARHLLLIPLTRQAIVQYCVKILVKALKVNCIELISNLLIN